MIKLIHTADWHIGRALYGRKRYHEFSLFLDWLVEYIDTGHVDALLVAGDIFDNTTPSNRAQELYYNFLCRVASSCCRHVVITAGNHDSPSFLNAPKDLLRYLNVHVMGNALESPEEEVLVLEDAGGEAELIVCAVPYLRDRDIRKAEAGESFEDKEQKLIDGIRTHYLKACEAAERIRHRLGRKIPIVAMGHLFTTGGRTIDGDGVRELYLGSLARVGSDIFPECIDYLALGHLHVSQRVGGLETKRYSGSPLPMGFGEAGQEKSLLLVEMGNPPMVTPVKVPRFQELEMVKGDWAAIVERLGDLMSGGGNAWLEIVYQGNEIMANLRERLEKMIEGSGMEILRIKNNRVLESVLRRAEPEETLDDLDADEVFNRCLDAREVPETQRKGLWSLYHETLASLNDDDQRAE